MNLNRIGAFSALSLLLAGCGESNASYFERIAAYGEPRNSVRQDRGIPIIPSNWVVRADRSAVAWDNPDFLAGKRVPMHQYKFLTFANFGDSGPVLAETDHYETGKTWVDHLAGTMHEYVRVTYSFELERHGNPPWEAEILDAGSHPKRITLAEAERILEGWGVQRPKLNSRGQTTAAQPHGATNGSQPVRAETTRTSGTAGSPR